MPRVVVEGGAELKRVAAKLRKVEAVELAEKTRKAQREAIKPTEEDIKAEAAGTLPSGYGHIMAKSVKVNTSLRKAQAVFLVKIKAKGKAEERDLREVNKGILRHPLFGKRKPTKKNKKVWFITQVKPGFVDRPINRTISRVVDSTSHAISAVLQEIVRE